jgi:hypothetical protein
LAEGSYYVVNDYCLLELVNAIDFVFLNWIELVLMVIMIHKIKDIKDELNIKNELVVVASVWFIFSLLYIIGRYISNGAF